MKIIDLSVRNGTAVVVGMILVILFGFLALDSVPIQLSPTIDTPIITVETEYTGAAPTEVESEVTRRQEERLSAVENLRELRSTSREGESEVSLRFDWGVNKDIAQLEVNQKLNLVRNLPDDVTKPQISAADSEENKSIMRITVNSSRPVNEVRELLEDTISPRIERVTGVGRVRMYGGSRREIKVLLDLPALESRQVTINEVLAALGRENLNLRGGKIESGFSRMAVRTVGQFESLDEIRATVVSNTEEGGPVRIEDIAEVVDTWQEPDRIGRTNGVPLVNVGIAKKSGSNTLEVCGNIREEIARLQDQFAGEDLDFWINYDASEYIWDSIYQVRDNLIVGAVLAVIVLLLFLRSVAATLAIGVMIPVCTIGTFVLLAAFDRSVNVISLAGLAFASGMVVDNGIVVMENIFRHRTQLGSDPWTAAREAAAEVWGPILASTLTTLAVFIPILFIQEEAGQLFRDLAYSISFAVGLSMIAAITIVPMIAARLLRKTGEDHARTGRVAGTLDRIGGVFSAGVLSLVGRGLSGRALRAGMITLIVGLFIASLALVPPAEYLPQSKNWFIFGNIRNPSGMSMEGADHAAAARIEHYILNNVDHLDRTFMVVGRESSFFGIFLNKHKVSNADVDRVVGEVQTFATENLPSDFRASVFRSSDFGWRGEGKSVTLDVQGPDLEALSELSYELEDKLKALPGVIGVNNSLNLANPELHVRPDRERLSDLGLDASDLAVVVETLLEGTRASLYREGGKEYDLTLEARQGQILHPEDLRGVTLKTPGGQDVRLGEIAEIVRDIGPTAIERLEQERVITLSVNLEEEEPLETFINLAEENVVRPARAGLPPGYMIQLSGSADDLRRTMAALSSSFLLALLIIYLLMAALFESFVYPLIILFSVPLAMTGAFLGVWITGSEFNVITMLGFVLLSGIVVNNAILIVEFALRGVREGTEIHEAVLSAVRVRMRPIFMTSATSILAMAPLALGRGVGTELYNGLGAAVLGGLVLSTLFTLVLIPLILATALELRSRLVLRLALPGREPVTRS